MGIATRSYICDLRYDDQEPDVIIPVIISVFPSLSFHVETHLADPKITPGRLRVTVQNVDGELHRAILEIPGVASFD